MKILISSVDESSSKNFAKVISHLKKKGHNIIEDKPAKGSEAKKDSEKLEKNIKNSDVLIVDASTHNFRTGYLIANALSEKKVVIALEKKSKNNDDSSLLNSKNIILKRYEEKDIIDVIDEGIEDAKNKLDTKFILIISPEIDRYLDWASQNKRMHKAQLVRNAIEGSMKKDKEYKDYLEGK